jgi:hypothetical protein
VRSCGTRQASGYAWYDGAKHTVLDISVWRIGDGAMTGHTGHTGVPITSDTIDTSSMPRTLSVYWRIDVSVRRYAIRSTVCLSAVLMVSISITLLCLEAGMRRSDVSIRRYVNAIDTCLSWRYWSVCPANAALPRSEGWHTAYWRIAYPVCRYVGTSIRYLSPGGGAVLAGYRYVQQLPIEAGCNIDARYTIEVQCGVITLKTICTWAVSVRPTPIAYAFEPGEAVLSISVRGTPVCQYVSLTERGSVGRYRYVRYASTQYVGDTTQRMGW